MRIFSLLSVSDAQTADLVLQNSDGIFFFKSFIYIFNLVIYFLTGIELLYQSLYQKSYYVIEKDLASLWK